MKKILVLVAIVIIAGLVIFGKLSTNSIEESQLSQLRDKYSEKHIPSVDHSKFALLQKKFNSVREVTAQCIVCHNKRHTEIMNSNHWNWEKEEYIEGRGIVSIGKKNIMNNFCIGTQGNETRCATCHISGFYFGF